MRAAASRPRRYNVPDTAHSIGADLEHTFGPSFVDQLRYSFQQTSVLFQSGAIPNCTFTDPDACTTNISFGSNQVKDNNPTPGSHSLISYGYATNIPQGRVVKVTQVQDNATWSTGRQSILFGGEYDYQNSPNPFLPDYAGAYSFSGSSNVFNNFMSGTTNSLTLGNGPYTSKFKENDYALYFQDDWKLTPHFTANLGIRYEFFGQAVNLLHDETVKRETNSATAFWDQTLPLSVRTFPYTNPNYKNFQPRIGFAWNPAVLQSKLVVRGGFAINFDPAFYNMFLNSATSAPVINLGTITGCGASKQCLPSSGSLASQVRAQSLGYLPTGAGINPGSRNTTINSSNFRNPYTESYLLGFEYGIGSHVALDVKYVGNHQVDQFQNIDGNPYLLPLQSSYPSFVTVGLCTDKTKVGYGRPDCTHANVRERTNGAFALYNSLQTRLTTKSYHGLTSELNWTYSKTIDNTSEVYSTEGGWNSITFAYNPLNPNEPERGLSALSMTHDAPAGFTLSPAPSSPRRRTCSPSSWADGI